MGDRNTSSYYIEKIGDLAEGLVVSFGMSYSDVEDIGLVIRKNEDTYILYDNIFKTVKGTRVFKQVLRLTHDSFYNRHFRTFGGDLESTKIHGCSISDLLSQYS